MPLLLSMNVINVFVLHLYILHVIFNHNFKFIFVYSCTTTLSRVECQLENAVW